MKLKLLSCRTKPVVPQSLGNAGWRSLIALGCLLFFSACAQNMQLRLDEVRAGYANNTHIESAAKFSGKKDFEKQNNLELLITGTGLFHGNEFAASDAAFEEFNKRNIDLTSGSLGREMGALLGGNMANSYRPYMMDSLFVSYYQIWSALATSRFDDARVIINQSYDRQVNMSREYSKLIEENQKSASDNQKLANQMHNENIQWGAFRDIMNPGLTYLSGVYFLNTGKYNDAKTYLKRANGMMPKNNAIATDLKAANAGTTPAGITWVFIESGFAPKLIEKRIDMAWPIGDSISIVSIAVSEPLFFDDGVYIDDAELLASVDAMFMTEYGEYRINEALRSWVSAVSKAALQSTMYNSGNDYISLFGGLAASIYSMTSTSAEVRTWATLPKNIYVMRIKNDKSGLLELKSNGTVISKIEIPTGGNNLVYIRTLGKSWDTKVIKIK